MANARVSRIHTDTKCDAEYVLEAADVVFIIDEAQGSYCDEDFWNPCVKAIADGVDNRPTPMVVFMLLSSYGSAESGPIYADGSAPVKLSRQQRISLKKSNLCCDTAQIYFILEEHLKLCAQLMARPIQRFKASPELIACKARSTRAMLPSIVFR